jgi:hypothetical protein
VMAGQGAAPFDHLLLTRVAVRLTGTSQLPAEQWLSSRMDLFSQYCAPSVDAQTVTDFRWLLFVDEAVPGWVVDRIDDVVQHPHEVIRLTEVWDAVDLGALVAERTQAPWTITSRLDSDDALARRYVERVQAAFAEQAAPVFLNFLNGAQYSAGRLSSYAHPSNAFLTLIEPRAVGRTPVTVMSVSHDVASRQASVQQVHGDPAWLQVLHGGNLVNGSSGWRAQPSTLAPHFVLAEELPELSRAALAVGRVKDAAAIVGRIAARPSRLRWIPRYLLARARGLLARAETP